MRAPREPQTNGGQKTARSGIVYVLSPPFLFAVPERTKQTAELVKSLPPRSAIQMQQGPHKDSAIRHQSDLLPLRFGRLLRGADCGIGHATGV